MAWFGEGLSSLKGQITSFTKEVLSEGRDEIYDASSELTASKKKVEVLEALCASQDLEISELRQRNAELQRILGGGDSNFTEDGWQTVDFQKAGLQKEDDLVLVLENANQELVEKTRLVEAFRQQVENLNAEKQHVHTKCSRLEEQVQKLSKQLEEKESEKNLVSESSELEQLHSQLKAATEQISQSRNDDTEELKAQLKVAELRIEELEKEVHRVQQQMLEQLSDSQVHTSEIRGDLEQTRWQLLQESGVQKTELLRARQDMVNRIIQMGEKSREVEMNMKKLQLDGKHLTADIAAIIHKLGDPEQQELIHGTIKALELENQVLKLRNAQLELAGNTESLKGSSKTEFEKKSDEPDPTAKYADTTSSKSYDESETASLKSEVSELSQQKQKLEQHVAALETQVERHERDIECFQVMRSDWVEEKQQMEQHLSDFKQQLMEREEHLSLVTAQKGLAELKKQTSDETSVLQKKLQDLSTKLAQVQEEREQLQQGKVCLSSEVEAMAKIVQDLESQLAKTQEENASLTQSLEELDEQHQGAIDQLLKVKQSLQKQNESLQEEVNILKQHHPETTKTAMENTNIETQMEENDLPHEECKRRLEAELQEKLSKLITFEIPQNYFDFNINNNDVMPLETVQALVKMCVEFKWKRDTLERKVAELMKDVREFKQKFEERDKVAQDMEKECKVLKANVETLIEELMVSKAASGEVLAPIPENSEEAEAMEQRILALESEVEVLREARSNLEADAKKLREEEQFLVRRLESATEALHNQENLHTELNRWQDLATSADAKIQELISEKQTLEEEVKNLQEKFVDATTSSKAEALYQQENLRSELASQQEALSLAEKRLQDMISDKQVQEENTKKIQARLQAELRNVENTLNSEKKKVENKLVTLSKQMETREGDLHSAEQLILQLEDTIDGLKCNLQEQEKQCHDSHISKDDVMAEEDVVALQKKLCEMEATKKNLEDLCTTSHISRVEYETAKADVMRLENLLHETSQNVCIKEDKYESELNEAWESKSNVEKELASLHLVLKNKEGEIAQLKQEKEEDQSLQEIEKELTSLHVQLKGNEDEIAQLKQENEECRSLLKARDEEIENFQTEKFQLEESLEDLRIERAEAEYQKERTSAHDQEAMTQEINKWKSMAEASERQLNEVLQVRAELEQECGRLYSIETKVQNQEHLERELIHLKESSDELEQRCGQLSNEKVELEKKLEEVSADLVHTQLAERDATERAVLVQLQLQATLQQKTGLEEKCLVLENAEEKLRNLEAELSKRKELTNSLQQELDEVSDAKSNLEAECKRLLAVEGKLRHQDTLETEVKELQEKLSLVEQELASASQAKINLGTLQTSSAESNKTDTASGENEDQLQVLQEQVQILQTERLRIMAVMDEKIRENGMLKTENSRLMEAITEQKSAVAKLEDERQFHDSEAAQMSKETIANLSKIIKDKDMEIEALKQKSETLVNLLQETPGNKEISAEDKEKTEADILRQELGRLNKERGELITTVQVKHQESLQYHAEIQRLTALLNEEIQKREAVRSGEVVMVQNQMQHRSSPVSLKEGDMELLPEELRQQMEALQMECARLADSLTQEQTRNKYLQNEVQEQSEKETSLLRELERLRHHMVAVEEGYTQETLRAEEQVRDLMNKLTQAEERIKNSSTAYTSASIRANQHVESLQGQARLIAQQRDEIQQKLSASEDQVQHHAAALRNLQIVLEQFQKDKEREIVAASEKIHLQLQAAHRRHEELQGEISALQVQLLEAKEGLSAAARLGEQLDKKSEVITSLKEEVSKLTGQLQEAENKVQSASLNVEGKVDRYLVKNLVLGYFVAPPNTRNQVLRVVATVLDFNQEERDRVGLDAAAASSSGWLKSILQPGKGPANMQSLSEAFVRFLENESRPQPQLRLLPEGQEPAQGNSRSGSPSSSTAGSQRRSPLLLSEVQLPTFTQFPVGRNSSSILKDVLKDS